MEEMLEKIKSSIKFVELEYCQNDTYKERNEFFKILFN